MNTAAAVLTHAGHLYIQYLIRQYNEPYWSVLSKFYIAILFFKYLIYITPPSIQYKILISRKINTRLWEATTISKIFNNQADKLLWWQNYPPIGYVIGIEYLHSFGETSSRCWEKCVRIVEAFPYCRPVLLLSGWSSVVCISSVHCSLIVIWKIKKDYKTQAKHLLSEFVNFIRQ